MLPRIRNCRCYYHHNYLFNPSVLNSQGEKSKQGVNDCNGGLIERKVPKNETAFPLCRAMDSLWNKNVVSLLSAVITWMHLMISINQSTHSYSAICPQRIREAPVRWLDDPRPAVLIVKGKKMCVVSSSWYFAVLLSAACLAAAPCSTDVELRWDSAKVSGTVTSYAIDFPLAHGINVAPLHLGVCRHVWEDPPVPWLLVIIIQSIKGK